MEDFQKYKLPAIALDVIIFTVKDNKLKVGIIKRKEEPYNGKGALPGRFIRYNEPIEETARIILKEKCSLDPEKCHLNQLYTFGQDLNRDTRVRTITIVYYVIIPYEYIDLENKNVEFFNAHRIQKLAFDHNDIVKFAIQKLQESAIKDKEVFRFMPEEFTQTKLQRVYEAILNNEIDKRNFRKKIAELKVLKDLKKQERTGAHRPAKLYSYKHK